jgi:hypothetical protein
MSLLSVLGSAARGINPEIDRYREKKERDQMLEQSQSQQMDERNFASAFSKSLMSDDVDGAMGVFEQYKGKVSPQTIQSATDALMKAKQEKNKAQVQSATQDLSGGMTPIGAKEQYGLDVLKQAQPGAEEAYNTNQDDMVKRENAMLDQKIKKQTLMQKLAEASKYQGGAGESRLVPDSIDKEVTAMLARGEITPQQAVDRIERSMGQNFEPDKKADLLSRYSSFSLTPLKTLGAEQLKKVTGASTVQEISEKALDKLGNPKVQEALGRIGGATNKLEGWITGKSSMPTEVVEFLQLLGFGTDFIARKQSGAALTQDEIDFYKTLTGSDLTSPSAIKTQLIGLIETLEDEKMAIYMQPLQIAYQGSVPDEVLEKLPRFKSKHKRGNADPASTSDIFSKVTYNESTGQWEAKDSQ